MSNSVLGLTSEEAANIGSETSSLNQSTRHYPEESLPSYNGRETLYDYLINVQDYYYKSIFNNQHS